MLCAKERFQLNDEINNLLGRLIDKEIDFTVVHHVEGTHLRSTGVLREVTDDLMKIEIEYRKHWWSRYKKGLYVCNRKTCSLLSLFIYKPEKNMIKGGK